MDVRSARLYGQFSLDKTLTLQAGSTVLIGLKFNNVQRGLADHSQGFDDKNLGSSPDLLGQ